MAKKTLQSIAPQGIDCAGCRQCTYKLYLLSDDSKGMYERNGVVKRFRMDILHSGKTAANQTYLSGGYTARIRSLYVYAWGLDRYGSNAAVRPLQAVQTDVRTYNRRDYTAALRKLYLKLILPSHTRPDIKKEEINVFRSHK